MSITHATSTGPIGETEWNENHAVDAAALRTALNVEDGATVPASAYQALLNITLADGTQRAESPHGLIIQ